MQEDSVFEKGGIVDKRLLNINLISAKSALANRDIYLKQIFNIGRRTGDSLNSIIPSSRFVLTSNFDDNKKTYVDDNPTGGFYSNIFFDSTKTADKIYYYKIENELAWKKINNQRYRGFNDIIGYSINIKHQFVSLKQMQSDTLFNNVIGGGEIYNTYTKNSFWFNFLEKYVLNGYNKGDNISTLVFRKDSKDSLNSVMLEGQLRSQSPDYIYSHYSSNHFSWDNHFEKMQMSSAEASFRMKKFDFKITAGIRNYNNILYLDNYAMPRQYKGNVSIFLASLHKDFTLFNWHLNNKIIYQNIPEHSVIRIPEFVLEHSLYYENELLKKALLLQIGVSMFYVSSYYADSYMPATSEFYIQNNKKYGNYPFIDFFINAKIKTVRIFFKIDHLNYGWNKNNYILTPGYPYPDRTFKLGINWRFYD